MIKLFLPLVAVLSFLSGPFVFGATEAKVVLPVKTLNQQFNLSGAGIVDPRLRSERAADEMRIYMINFPKGKKLVILKQFQLDGANYVHFASLDKKGRLEKSRIIDGHVNDGYVPLETLKEFLLAKGQKMSFPESEVSDLVNECQGTQKQYDFYSGQIKDTRPDEPDRFFLHTMMEAQVRKAIVYGCELK